MLPSGFRHTTIPFISPIHRGPNDDNGSISWQQRFRFTFYYLLALRRSPSRARQSAAVAAYDVRERPRHDFDVFVASIESRTDASIEGWGGEEEEGMLWRSRDRADIKTYVIWTDGSRAVRDRKIANTRL